MFSHLINKYYKTVKANHFSINRATDSYTQSILRAASETILHGARKNYRPYWTEELQGLEDEEDEVARTREKVENDATPQNNIAHKSCTAKYQKAYIQAARTSWREKNPEKLNVDRDGNKLWKRGPDKITNEMLKHLGTKAKSKPLGIFNCSWKTGHVPHSWWEADMAPIHKKGKDQENTDNYHSISLTSCVGKLREKLINTHLVWHLLPFYLTGTSDSVHTEHLLQSCPLYELLRKGIWPNQTPAAGRHYFSLGEQWWTATFIEETGVSIWQMRRRRRMCVCVCEYICKREILF